MMTAMCVACWDTYRVQPICAGLRQNVISQVRTRTFWQFHRVCATGAAAILRILTTAGIKGVAKAVTEQI